MADRINEDPRRWRWYTEECLTNKGRSMDQLGLVLLIEALESPCACEGGESIGLSVECRWNPLNRSWRRTLVPDLPLHLEPDVKRMAGEGRQRVFARGSKP